MNRQLGVEDGDARGDEGIAASRLDLRRLVGNPEERRELGGGEGGGQRDVRKEMAGVSGRSEYRSLGGVDHRATAERDHHIGFRVLESLGERRYYSGRRVLADLRKRANEAFSEEVFDALQQIRLLGDGGGRGNEDLLSIEPLDLIGEPADGSRPVDDLVDGEEEVGAVGWDRGHVLASSPWYSGADEATFSDVHRGRPQLARGGHRRCALAIGDARSIDGATMAAMDDPRHASGRSTRLAGYDYASNGAYMVTICTRGRHPIFGRIIDREMHTSGDRCNRARGMEEDGAAEKRRNARRFRADAKPFAWHRYPQPSE